MKKTVKQIFASLFLPNKANELNNARWEEHRDVWDKQEQARLDTAIVNGEVRQAIIDNHFTIKIRRAVRK